MTTKAATALCVPIVLAHPSPRFVDADINCIPDWERDYLMDPLPPRVSQLAIAPHLREPIFRAYEELLTTAVASWPKPTSFTLPPNVASSTFLANFRNSIISLKRYGWTPTTVDRSKLLAIETPRAFIVTYEPDGKLWFRSPRERVVKPVVSSSSVERAPSPRPVTDTSITPIASSLVPWRDWTEADLEAACLLIDKQRITGPILLVGRVDEARTNHFMSIYNIAFVYDEERDTTILT